MSGGGGGERPLVAVLDYGIGNLRSAEKALVHVGADARLTADRGLVERAGGLAEAADAGLVAQRFA